MTIPFELALRLEAEGFNPNNLELGRSFYYSDANPEFAISGTSRNLVVTDSTAVAGQIEIIIGTPIGSEPFEITFGSEALRYVFANNSERDALELSILTALKQWLGRRLDFFSVNSYIDGERGDIYVAIPFRIKIDGVQKTYVGNLSSIQKMAA